MTIADLKIGESGIIKSVGGQGELRQHFLDMGMIPGEKVTLIKHAPMGDPLELKIFGYELTLRKADSAQIVIEPIESEQSNNFVETVPTKDQIELKNQNQKNQKKKSSYTEHPGFGEEGKYHQKESENPLPGDAILTYALVGNQNCGKTTLFNALTGSNQHVGNFPGVTVDRKDGVIKGYPNTLITDLPGIYSMSPYTSEEIVSRNFVLKEKPKAIINILDANLIERNLYLTMQLLELDIPMVIAVNMMDEVTGNGGSIDINAMEKLLGVPVIPISAAKNQGVDELVKHAIHIAHYQEKPIPQDFCNKDDSSGAVHRAVHAVIHLIHDHAERAQIPVRFAASKIIEGDKIILNELDLDFNEIEMLEHIVLQMEKESGLDRSAAIAKMRFSFINKICCETVIKPRESKEHNRSQKLDKILTGKFTAIPAFILIMALVFFLTFNVIGAFLQAVLESGIESVTQGVSSFLLKFNVNPALYSLIIDGIFSGVGAVLSFLPIIITLFFFLSLMEDSGYIARVAFVMDKLLRKLGLSGRSIVPLLIGFGCTVPAVMATRTLPSERDRKMTILLTPFMSCTAKLPIYAFFVSAFFPKNGGFVMIILYLLGMFVGVFVSLLLKKTLFKGEAVPFVMELPNYRLPTFKNTTLLLWEKAKDFLQRAFTIIFLATIVIWFLQSFDVHFNLVEDSKDSILATISGFMEPIFKPIGLGDWRICTSLITGFIAKESVVSTINILFGSQAITSVLSCVSAMSLLVFCLLYTPCVAAISSIKRELGVKWAITVVLWQCVIAWLCSFVVYFVGNLL